MAAVQQCCTYLDILGSGSVGAEGGGGADDAEGARARGHEPGAESSGSRELAGAESGSRVLKTSLGGRAETILFTILLYVLFYGLIYGLIMGEILAASFLPITRPWLFATSVAITVRLVWGRAGAVLLLLPPNTALGISRTNVRVISPQS